MQYVQKEVERIIAILKRDQKEDGSWAYPFETGFITDAYMIILFRLLEWKEEELIAKLVARIESRQEDNGAWKLFYDEKEGNLSLTIDCYYALLFSGIRQKTDPHMLAAKQFILDNGGPRKAAMFTKILLAVTGQYKWPAVFPIPIEVVLLPSSFLISIYDISVFGRSNIIPLLLLGNKKFQLMTAASPSLEELSQGREEEDWEEFERGGLGNFFNTVKHGVKALIGLPHHLHSLAIEGIKRYMLGHMESDGTLYSYFSSTFYMIMALLALGYPKEDRVILRAVNGLKAMACRIDGQVHMQYTTANVWNTSLISYTLQEAGLPAADESVRRANAYLLSRQQNKYGDWILHNPHAFPGGWGFSDSNTINPDVDDTTASLRALFSSYEAGNVKESFRSGFSFTLSMQNDDGGWPAFERNVDKKLLHLLPIQGAEYILTDPSTPDLTGRTLEFLGRYERLKTGERKLKKGIKWLYKHQRKDGSWYGRWGICYIYGTWAALTGLMAAGESPLHPQIKKAANWLLQIQNPDGGWGESCYSDINRRYEPLGCSTAVHTAWAADALIALYGRRLPQVEKAIAWLVNEGGKEDWTIAYPAGQGMANFFYIHYHSYRYIFPLLCLSHYLQKEKS
ncbi:terpene cyclase/mutase family protein [Peribacillus kribbensis]|uniref:terpene cyclase/mutase family protein n=1 Tax=Peribacillus kribbensis TaxID=356658 RepID=UPI0004234D52|nr:prenyltransferase/squalene oxidase repeat-containing protein [Peribacillus kribbensis]